MFHKIKSVQPMNEYRLSIQFSEGVVKVYSLKSVIGEIEEFKALIDVPDLFAQVVVDPGGYGISWNDDLDLSCDELWANGETIETPFDGLIAFGDATELWNLNESTLRKAISYGKLVPGIDVCKYGKQWIITRSAMEREYGKPNAG